MNALGDTKQQSTGQDPIPAKGVDLSQLAVKRQAVGPASVKSRRRWVSRYAFPMGILGAFGGLFGWAARDSFLPAHVVTVTPVIVTRADVQQEGTPLFQAAGWIEPQPSPVIASALAAGVIQEMLVVEGQMVEAGAPIARLIDADARITLQQAEANFRLAQADAQNADAVLTAAKAMLENPNELKVALAESESLLAETTLTLNNLPFAIKAAQNRRQVAAENLARKEDAGDAVAGRILREAAAELSVAEGALAELQSRQPTLREQLEALTRKRGALRQQLELMTEPKRAVAASEAKVAAAKARQDQAQLAVDVARLNLERMVVRAPITGRILTIDARPGKRLAGMDLLSEQTSSTVATLYDPKRLQVRVDVRLEDVPQVQVGQPATIETAAMKTPLTGEVLWLTTRADIQKNTLQVKVAIKDPPQVITPEMLGQITFLAPPQPVTADIAGQEPLRLLVPRSLVTTDDTGSFVWVADAELGIAARKSVELGRAGTDQLVEIVTGLDPTSKLVVGGRESVTAGTRIRIAGEDRSSLATTTASNSPPQAASTQTTTTAVE